MADMIGRASLQETALKLNVTVAWINKVQSRTGIPITTGEKGRRVFFYDEEIHMLTVVKILRSLNFTLEDIKSIFEKEKRMISKFGKGSMTLGKTKIGRAYIIHSCEILTNFETGEGEQVNCLEDKEYSKGVKKIIEISREINRRFFLSAEEKKILQLKTESNAGKIVRL